MKKVLILLCVFAFNFEATCVEQDQLCQYRTAVELCFKGLETGFIAAKAAMKTYKNDKSTIILLKQAMCFCIVSEEYNNDLLEIANDVTNESSIPLAIGAAWYQKSRISNSKCDYKKSLHYSSIALETLKQSNYQADDGKTSYREIFEGLCHFERKIAFEELNDKRGIEEENEILNKYSWFKDSI